MTAYFKLSGGGNDFLGLVDPPDNPSGKQIQAWCRRGLSLGADGVFVLRRSLTGASMDYFNADGGAADLCLNATRCAVRLALHLGWAESRIEIQTAAAAVAGELIASGDVALEIEMPPTPDSRQVLVGASRHDGWAVSVGVPHFVIPWPEGLATAPVAELGPALRSHSDFGRSGTNVDFVRFLEPHHIEIRSYERGVESETLACGTGVLAAVATGLELGALSLPVAALTQGGFTLRVVAEPQPGRWSLQGDARILSRGELLAGAEELPQPARWS